MDTINSFSGKLRLTLAAALAAGSIAAVTPVSAGEDCDVLYDVTDLGTLGGASSTAYGINNRGQVVGESHYSPTFQSHAFIWTRQGGMQDLGTLGGGESSARGINNHGQVVGDSETATGHYHAFIWTRRDGMQDLGTLGGGGSFASDIKFHRSRRYPCLHLDAPGRHAGPGHARRPGK